MKLMSLASPTKLEAVQTAEAYTTFQALSESARQKAPIAWSPWLWLTLSVLFGGIMTVCMGTFAGAPDPAAPPNWWLLGLGVLAVLGGGAGTLILFDKAPPQVKADHQKHLKRGNIIQVPVVVVEIVDQAASKTAGLTRWSEWPQRRFNIVVELTTTAAVHVLKPLLEECSCGQPATCESTTHVGSDAKQHLLEQLRQIVGDEVAPHVEAYIGRMESVSIERADRDSLLLGDKSKPPITKE